MQIGFIGLGKMGSRMAEKLLQEGHEVVAWNRSAEPADNLKLRAESTPLKGKLVIAKTVKDLVGQLTAPKVVWLMLPAGVATQTILDEVVGYIEKDDIVIDGGNAKFSDTEERYQKLRNKEIRFLGIGVSGGIIAALQGYPLMVGGDKSAYEHIVPLLDSLSKDKGGHEYFGEGGAGHFVKMVHNGIEYGIMQALAEGFAVMKKSPYDLDLLNVAKLYQQGTLVSGFMLDRAVEALTNHPDLEGISGSIPASGEADWTIEQAKKEGVEVPIIEASLDYRNKSLTDPKIQESFTAKMVNGLRHAFGGHSVKK